jgi:transcription elongation factor Elf1
MNYWLGSGVDSYEEDRTLYCPTCDNEQDEVPCIIEGSQGTGECPHCGTEITFDVE